MLNERKRKWFDAVVWSVSALFAAGLAVDAAHAESHRYAVDNAAYRAECGSCHVAYPPALLGAEVWHTIMQGLNQHFGTDASVSDDKRTEITAYLAAASGGKSRSATTPRITESRWFRKEHAEIAAATWKLPAVKSAANCEACHRQANAGDFGEQSIRVPR
ncbi:MAG TPA: diheme cytochrome c [Burkholderiaceae bacterium]|nr:diheme cytochrome c [Burkholderiaceae bacterium]